MSTLALAEAGGIVLELAAAINANKAWLSEIDGAIGDGDHGINMSKGFTQAADKLGAAPGPLDHAMQVLGNTLLGGIGGSMGPLYGTFFLDMAASLSGAERMDAAVFRRMLKAGTDGVADLGGAKPGDKTLMDALVPALEALDAEIAVGATFPEALDAMTAAAERGRDSTKDLAAKIGRAARLGERSRGVLDAGAASCALLLGTMAEGIKRRLA